MDDKDIKYLKLEIEKEIYAKLEELIEKVADRIEEKLRYSIKDMIDEEKKQYESLFVRKDEFGRLFRECRDKEIMSLESKIDRKAELIKNIVYLVTFFGGILFGLFGVLVKLGVIK